MSKSQSSIQLLNDFLNPLGVSPWVFWGIIAIFLIRGIGLTLLYKKNGEASSCLLGLFPGLEVIPKLIISRLPLNIVSIPFFIYAVGFIKELFSEPVVHINTSSSHSSVLSLVLLIVFIIAYIFLEIMFLNNINKSMFWALPLIITFIPVVFTGIPVVVAKTILYIALAGMTIYSIMLIVWGTSKEVKYEEPRIVSPDAPVEDVIPEAAKHDGYINPYLASYYEKEKKEKMQTKYVPVDNASAYNLGSSLNDKKAVTTGNNANYEDKFFKSESTEEAPKRRKKDKEEANHDIDFDSFVEDKKEE